MRTSRLLAFLRIVTCFGASAQTEMQDRKQWLKANMYDAQDAVDFITTTYSLFTPLITRKNTETGIYKRIVKLKDCELVITTESRTQESSWKSDHEFEKNLV